MRPGQRGHGQHAGGEGAQPAPPGGGHVAHPAPGQEVDGAEGQDGHVDDGPEEVEEPEGRGVPAEGGAGPEAAAPRRRRSARATAQASSWRRRRPSQRSKVAAAKAPASRVGGGQRAVVMRLASVRAVTGAKELSARPVTRALTPCARECIHVRRHEAAKCSLVRM